MDWLDIRNNLTSGVANQGKASLNSITDAWDDFKNIDALSLPTINGQALFTSVSQVASIFSGAGVDDTVQTQVLRGLDEIWKKDNTELQRMSRATVGTATEKKPDISITKKDGGLVSISDSKASGVNAKFAEYINSNFDIQITEKDVPATDQRMVTNFQSGAESGQGYYDEVVDTSDADRLNFQTPDWGYADFINERNIFKKSLQNPLGEQGWFYFKIFFNFDTQYGLFGGLLNNRNPMAATNSAYKYLHACESLGDYYKTNERQVALLKFAKILSYISTYAPWFFKGIKNLNQANIPIIKDLTKERSIEIECSNDAIDMRLNTLLDLYKFACYDEINQKEIVPDNLRKFDMTIMLFQSPLKYFHTSFKTDKGTKYNYKGASVNNKTGFSDTMSFKMFTFINCEIDLESLGNMVPGSMTNEAPFNMGGGSIKIIYDRVYTHTMNEFMHIMFGNDGLYYDGSSSTSNSLQGVNTGAYAMQTQLQKNRLKDIGKIYDTSSNTNADDENYKAIVDASEELCINNMRSLGFNALGNFSGPQDPQFTRTSAGEVKLSDYLNLKLNFLLNDSAKLGGLIEELSPTADNIVQDLIMEYQNRQNIIRAMWPQNTKILPANNISGRVISSGRRDAEAIMYWQRKWAEMRDGKVSPETLGERYMWQNYDYTNFTKNGYSDKRITTDNKGRMIDGPGTEYWKRKIAAMSNGPASPETIDQQYEGTVPVNSNDNDGHRNFSVSEKTILDKIRKLKNGNK